MEKGREAMEMSMKSAEEREIFWKSAEERDMRARPMKIVTNLRPPCFESPPSSPEPIGSPEPTGSPVHLSEAAREEVTSPEDLLNREVP